MKIAAAELGRGTPARAVTIHLGPGRRPIDDVVTVELRALAGLTYPLIDKNYKPDAAVNAVTDGLTGASVASPPTGHFPYLGTPYDGYHNPSS